MSHRPRAAWRLPRLLSPALLLLSGCTAPIAASLSEEDANRVALALGRAGVAAEKEADPGAEGRYRVQVHRDDASKAVAVLREEELPPRPAPGVLEAVGKSSLVPSAAVEHAQYIAGLSNELERTLGGIDGVVAARVHLSAPPRAPFDQAPARATASVLLKHRGPTAPVDPEAVQRLVAGAVAGLSAADVAVVLVPRLPQGPAAADLTALGPVVVTRSTAGYLRALLALAVAASAAPTLALLWLWQRGRKAAAGQPGAP